MYSFGAKDVAGCSWLGVYINGQWSLLGLNSSVKLAADWILGIHIYESAAKCKIGSRLNIGISYFQDWVNLVWGPCLRSLFFLVPCQGYVWTVWWPFLLSFTSGPDRDLKFSRLSQHGPRPMSKECVLFGTMSGLFVDCVGTMFGLALLQNHLELWNLQYWVNMVQSQCLWSVYFRLPSGPCLDHAWSMFDLSLLQDKLEL